MSRTRLWLCFLLLAALAGGPPARAFEDDTKPPMEQEQKEGSPKRKRQGFFRQPEKGTPAEQLAYANELRDGNHFRLAIKQYDALVHTWHESPEAPKAQIALARLRELREQYERAFEEYQYLIEYFAGDFDYESVIEAQFRMANALRTVRHGDILFFPGYTRPEDALPKFEQIVKNAPRWKRAPEAQYAIGLIHEDSGEVEEAVAAYETLALLYPESPYAASASLRRAYCLYDIAEGSPRDERSARNALSALSVFLRDHPDDAEAQKVTARLDGLKKRLSEMYYERAEFYDRIAKKPKAARIAYQDYVDNFPNEERTEEARDRIRELEKKEVQE